MCIDFRDILWYNYSARGIDISEFREVYMKIKRIGKTVFIILLILIALLILFTLGTFIYHRIKTKNWSF